MYIKKILLFIVLLTFIGGGLFSYNIYSKIFEPNTKFESDKQEVFIPTGSTFDDIVVILKPYLKNTDDFIWLANKKGYTARVKAGRYILKKNANTNEIISTLRSGNTAIKLSFNNQERLENLAGRIASQIELDSVSLLQAFKDESFLKKNNFNMDNALSMYIPNSYQVYWNTSAEALRNKLFREYNNFWNSNRKTKAKEIGLTPKQVITLASIVHKETVKIDERPKVAGVYMNRLKKGMKLEADPTVIYAMKKQSNNWDTIIKRVLRKDLVLDHSYNTYQNVGLPPGPITMPDISAIDAVLNYEKHDYIFFVADIQNFGYHKFAKTLLQHNRNSSKYHKWINNQGIKR